MFQLDTHEDFIGSFFLFCSTFVQGASCDFDCKMLRIHAENQIWQKLVRYFFENVSFHVSNCILFSE